MLVVKTELRPGGDSNAVKEIGRLKIISQNPHDLSGSQISSYTYEMADPGEAPFPLKGTGSVPNHFRQQSVWILVEKVLRDMDKRSLLMHQQTGGPDKEDHHKTIVARVEIWGSGYEKNAVEIARLEITGKNDDYDWEIIDPVASNLALAGDGLLTMRFMQQPVWALIKKALEQARASGVLTLPADDSYAAVAHAWLDAALKNPRGPNATTHFRSALNAYTFAFQQTDYLTPDLGNALSRLTESRDIIRARAEKGIDTRYAWIINRGLELCPPDHPLKPALADIRAALQIPPPPAQKGITAKLSGLLHRLKHSEKT